MKKKRRNRRDLPRRAQTGIYISGKYVYKAFKGRNMADLPIYSSDTLQLGHDPKDDSYWLEYVPQTAFWFSNWFEIPKSVGLRLMKSWEALE